MADVHCHILPGIDDGAQNMSDSIEIAKAAVADGIHTIVATPHYRINIYENNKQTILNAVHEVNKALVSAGIDLKIFPGQEPRIDGDLLKLIDLGEVITINGSHYLLVEFPTAHVPRYTEKLFYDLQLNGLVPIIVHPERNQEIVEHPDLLYHFVEKGALTQVTAASICGDFGKKIKNFALELVEYNLTHFIASDAHNTTSRRTRMHEAFEIISAKFSNEFVYMFKENAEFVTEGKNVYKEMPEKIRKKKRFKLF